jgi:choline dehydrogenase-like flavoprotein
MVNLSRKEFNTLRAICDKIAPGVPLVESRIIDVINSLHPIAQKAWKFYLKRFGDKIIGYSDAKLKKKAYESPFREFIMPIRYAAFAKEPELDRVFVRYERWKEQIIEDVKSGQVFECDYVVVGSGAGGASVAYKLASMGHAVLIVEEGDYYDRPKLRGDPLFAFKNLYRNRGFTMAWGKKIFPILAGCAVGGTTIINSGTCIRYPKYIFEEWEDRFDLINFNSEVFNGYYDQVASILNVEEVDDKYIGKVGERVREAANKLGWESGPLPRNAEGCDGQATCCFGCPSGAKTSTNISFIPRALKNGAQLLINTKVTDIVLDNKKVIGVTLETIDYKKNKKRACIVPEKGVIVACGALMTPQLLRKVGIENHNIGRNLSLHPALAIFSMHKNEINMTTNSVPQSYHVPFLPYCVLEGASMPPTIAAMAMTSVGKEFSYLMNNYNKLSMFGAMIRDTSKGFVLKNGHVLYNMNNRDLSTLKDATSKLIKLLSNIDDVQEVYPFINGLHKMGWYSESSPWKDASINKYWRLNDVTTRDFTLSSYHPLGSCRMGVDPSNSVVGEDFKVWGTENLYVVDGSIFPDSTGLNPSFTISAMGFCAANIIG